MQPITTLTSSRVADRANVLLWRCDGDRAHIVIEQEQILHARAANFDLLKMSCAEKCESGATALPVVRVHGNKWGLHHMLQ